MDLNEIAKSLEKNQVLIFDKQLNIVMIQDEPAPESPDVDGKVSKVYLCHDNEMKEFDLDEATDFIIDSVGDKVNLRDLLKEVLKTSHPQDIIQAYQRLKQPGIKEKVATRHGCFSIVIPGNNCEDDLELVVRS